MERYITKIYNEMRKKTRKKSYVEDYKDELSL